MMSKKCNFCGKEYDQSSSTLVITANDNTCICQNCLERANKMIKDAANQKDFSGKKPETPSEIKAFLDKYVIGQETAKKVLSVAVYNHMKMLEYYDKNPNPDVEFEKNNCLIVGPTGCGKTYLIKTIAKILDVPYAICDATGLTESGYVGADVESVLQKLLLNAGNDIEKAQRGIVYIDEIDKKANKGGESSSITRDVSGEGVQQAFLKLIEGSIVDVPISGRRLNPEAKNLQIDTSKILFIVGGAFPNIEKIIKKRLKYKNVASIGISLDGKTETLSKDVEYNEVIDKVTHEDFKKFGLIPEFLGRLPVICPLHELSEDEMCRILTEPKNALIKQFKALVESNNTKVEFDDKAIKAVAKKAIKDKTGARGLRTILSKTFLEPMYKIPDMTKNNSKYTIKFAENCILNNELPQIIEEKVRKAV